MNSTLILKEEQQDTSSIELDRIPKYRIPHTPLECFQDAATTAIAVYISDLSSYTITAPRIDLTFVQKQVVKRLSVARPVVSPVEFEVNPIVRVYPTIGKRYPMRVVRRSTASVKLTSVQMADEDMGIQSID